jgi:tRNA (uracil-5-)-methyltransferase
MMAQKRAFNEGKRHFKKNKKQKTSTVAEGSNEEVLLIDVRSLLERLQLERGDSTEEKDEEGDISKDTDKDNEPVVEQAAEIDVTIRELSSTGDGLGVNDKDKYGQVYVVPFTAPGDTVTARVYRRNPEESYALADLVTVVNASAQRSPEPPKCGYFAKCSGCQFQHLPYSFQLTHKKSIVEKAYRNFSRLPPSSVPAIGDTIGSPLQYGYRTKLTPHFDGPPGGRRDKRQGKQVTWPEVPPIGFMLKGTRKTMDIEDCPIGTDAVRLGMKRERTRVASEINKYQKGATLLLRESTERIDKGAGDGSEGEEKEKEYVVEDRGEHVYRKTCITDHKATSTEYVEQYRFDNPAGSFFQNNNSILPVVTQYIRENILGQAAGSDTGAPAIRNMVDAYCGSGFFTVILSSMFTQSIGIDISGQSIDFASKNAELNHLPADGTRFIAADANNLFDSLDTTKFPPEETVVVIDPPRKGCDHGFIRQLLEYSPARICYVSCNVHTQARDVGWLVGGLPNANAEQEAGSGMYEIESLRGFDFFPQTSHVEGVAILRKKVTSR